MDGKLSPDSHAELVRRLLFEREVPLPYKSRNIIHPSSALAGVKMDAWTQKISDMENLKPSSVSPSLERKPFQIILSVLGALPLSFDTNNQANFKIFSPIFIYSVLVYAVIVYTFVTGILLRRISLRNVEVDQLVKNLIIFVYFFKYVLQPLTMWLAMTRICNFNNKNLEFENRFRQVTGYDLDCGLRNTNRIVAVVIVIVSLATSVCYLFLDAEAPIWTLPVSMAPLLLGFSFDATWATSCTTLGMAATQLVARLKQNLARCRGDSLAQERVVRAHRGLWLELSQNLQNNNDISTVTFSYHVLQAFLMLTLSLYALLSSLRLAWSYEQITLAVSSLLFLVELWFIANAGHYVAEKFDKIQWDPYFLIPHPETQPNVKREMWLLLEEASVSPRVIDIGGFLVINRSWLTNLLGSLLSSLIILLQFKVQSQGDEHGANTPGGNNATVMTTSVE